MGFSFFFPKQLKTDRKPKYFQPIPKCPTTEVNFSISPETLQKTAKERISIPRFLITGHLDFTECCLMKPFTGHVMIII